VVIDNPSHPGLTLSASSNSNPYAVPFLDVHDNINHHAVVFQGLSNLGGPEASFSVSVVGTSATQYYLAVTLFGTTFFSRMQFQLLLIGNEAAGIIEARSFSSYVLKQVQLFICRLTASPL
jgi:hypothetical protein